MGKLNVGDSQSYGNPGDTIAVSVDGQSVSAIAATPINTSKVLVATTDTGTPYVFTNLSTVISSDRRIARSNPRKKKAIVSNYPFKVLAKGDAISVQGFDDDTAVTNSGDLIGFNNTGDGYAAIVKQEDNYLFSNRNNQVTLSLTAPQFVNEQMPFFSWVGGNVLISNGRYANYTGTVDNTPLGQNWFAVAEFDHDGGIFRSIFSGVYNSEDVTGSEVNNYGGNLGTGSTTYEDVPITGGTANHSRNITAAPTHIYSYDFTQKFQLPVLVDGQLINVETQLVVSNSNNFSESRTESGELVETFTSGSFLPTLTDLTYTGTASMTSSESGSSSFELSFDYPFIVDSVKKIRRINNIGTRSGSGSGSVVESLDWGFAGSTVSIGYDIYNTTIATHIVNGTGTLIDFAPSIVLIGGSNQEIVLYYYLAIESNYTTSSGIDVNRDTTISRPRYLTTNNEFTRFSFFWGTALSPQWNVLMGDYGIINEYTQEYVYPPIESLNVQINDITYEITDTYADYGDHFYIGGSSNTSFENEGSYTFNVSNVQIGVSDRNKGLYGLREQGTNSTYPEGYYELIGKSVNVFWIVDSETKRYSGTITSMDYTESTTGSETYRNYTGITIDLSSGSFVDFYCWSNVYSNGVVITPSSDHTVSLTRYLNYERRAVNAYPQGNTIQVAISQKITSDNLDGEDEWFADIYEFNTTAKRFERIGNESGSLSEITGTEYDFVSYYPV